MRSMVSMSVLPKDKVFKTYNRPPLSQKMTPNKTPIITVIKNLMALNFEFLQYDQCCFQKQALHWVAKLVEYWVGKWRSVEPGCGVLSSLMRS